MNPVELTEVEASLVLGNWWRLSCDGGGVGLGLLLKNDRAVDDVCAALRRLSSQLSLRESAFYPEHDSVASIIRVVKRRGRR